MNQTGNPRTNLTVNPVILQHLVFFLYWVIKRTRITKVNKLKKRTKSHHKSWPAAMANYWSIFRRLALSLRFLLFTPTLNWKQRLWNKSGENARAEIKISLFTALRVACAISICTVWPRDIYSFGLSFLYRGASFPSPWCVHMLITSGILGHGGQLQSLHFPQV